ncbi:hypothetical protein TEQG_01326 [Trichophyton equinum CBS 127.97]|uniref:Uncharacterized protein n=1 Tax=Trichophyton equinum (strain ATCC MYA-4606 / CBS 127.97) TaxID=559882 RepID=F2PK69_TRIEC|nr:hypothetical protein TEQG_01326 [Trichophyton equinum CBS 127.97]
MQQQLARSGPGSLPGWPLRLFLTLNAKLLPPEAYIYNDCSSRSFGSSIIIRMLTEYNVRRRKKLFCGTYNIVHPIIIINYPGRTSITCALSASRSRRGIGRRTSGGDVDPGMARITAQEVVLRSENSVRFSVQRQDSLKKGSPLLSPALLLS